ncbi:mitochondrial ribosomal protein subunit L20-domain-containing protein [Daldinia caldariorum]|uniref:mitochondrial ribosomal protein subunit L20-domain-containing protein n=1 Tax=Daldinia caldariorum TaxID=326644 RepID=UPI0020087863|nr:mitochondrial ribosomal protein subunit L20-domain-containing protein [Daldinia caldariorum]KAI1468101.1 mitochondrial ribosomal protein subunit L20-domain-containing protein [Daldinia caldariorum]
MESRPLLQPLLRSINAAPVSTSTRAAVTIASIPRRYQSSTARTKRALKIAPHPSFFPPDFASSSESSTQLIYNPPSSAPSVYHTPFKFLPPSDPRRKANLAQLLRPSADDAAPSKSAALPPELKDRERKYNVTEEQVEEMRMLRATDPERWSVLRLAERYGCAPYFILMCCRAPEDHRQRERERLEGVKARWGAIRAAAREERKKRKDMLHKGLL